MSDDTPRRRRSLTSGQRTALEHRVRHLQAVTEQWLAELTRGNVIALHASRRESARRAGSSAPDDQGSGPDPPSAA